MTTDFRYALRGLKRARWYSAAVIGVVALTLALATTVFAIVDGVLFRPLPYPDADRLVSFAPTFRSVPPPPPIAGMKRIYGASAADLEYWRSAVPGLQITGFRVTPWSNLLGGVNEDVGGAASVQRNFFDVIGMS